MSNLTISNNNGDEKNIPGPTPFREAPDEWFELDSLPGESQPKNKLGMHRRQARSIALQTLFESDAVNHDPQEVVERHIETADAPPDAAQFARLLVNGVTGKRTRLDELIATSAPNWPMDQMAKVDKNILRLAIFEILFNNDVPTRAAINEAIELAKNFGSESSSRFVNGVLGAIVTQQKEPKAEADT